AMLQSGFSGSGIAHAFQSAAKTAKPFYGWAGRLSACACWRGRAAFLAFLRRGLLLLARRLAIDLERLRLRRIQEDKGTDESYTQKNLFHGTTVCNQMCSVVGHFCAK